MEAYRVIKQIGKGSYGQVFLVKHNGTKKQVWNLQRLEKYKYTFFTVYVFTLIRGGCTYIKNMQYVVKKIKLVASSAKERLAAEQEVWVCRVKCIHGGVVRCFP